MRPYDDDGDAEADRRSERRARRDEAQRHFDFVKERHQVDGPIEVEGCVYFSLWYWDEELGKLGSIERKIDHPWPLRPQYISIYNLEVNNAIWHLARLRKRELDARHMENALSK